MDTAVLYTPIAGADATRERDRFVCTPFLHGWCSAALVDHGERHVE